MQWGSFIAELTSVVVLWLRGRALLLAALFWLSFHLFTVTILYIHFAPTLICWLAFAPLERIVPWLRRQVRPEPVGSERRHARQAAVADRVGRLTGTSWPRPRLPLHSLGGRADQRGGRRRRP
jgi:hypothetical protein